MASMFRQNFSTGMNYLRRRFSSDDLYHERDDLDELTPAVGNSSSSDIGGARSSSSMSQQTMTGSGSKMPSAPSFPSLSSVQDMTRGILSQAAAAANSAVTAATQGTIGSGLVMGGGSGMTPQRIVCNNERCKVLLIIDDKHTDWARFFRGRKVFGDWELRVEQAEFANISVAAYSESGAIVDIRVTRDGQDCIRSFQPDFVLVRQHARDANDNWKHTVLALHYGGLPGVNSLQAVYNFLDKPWVFSHLLQIQRRHGPDRFPVISQSFYPNYREMISNLWLLMPKFPLVIKIGHAHSGLGKVRVDNHYSFQDIGSVMAVTGCYSTTEPLIDAQCDIYIQKIGSHYRAFMRKAMSGNWKANVGAAILEQIQMTERYKFWVDECSQLFGGLDILAVKAIRGKDGKEYIIEVDDSTMPLLGNTKEDDIRMIAELTINKLQACCKPTPLAIIRPPASSAAGSTSAMNGFQVEHHNHVQQTPGPVPSAVVQRPMPVPQQSQQPMPSLNTRPMPQQQNQQQQQQQQYQQQQQQQQQHYAAAVTSSAGTQRQIVSAVVHSDRPSIPQQTMGRPPPVAPPNVSNQRQPPSAYVQRSISGPPSPSTVDQIARDLEGPEADDTMNNLRKTFAGIFGSM